MKPIVISDKNFTSVKHLCFCQLKSLPAKFIIKQNNILIPTNITVNCIEINN